MIIREARDTDLDFCFKSWIDNYLATTPNTGMEHRFYFIRQRQLIQRILDRSTVLCACDPDAEDVVWGYVVFEPRMPPAICHWLYVKGAFRSWFWVKRPGQSRGAYVRQKGKGGIGRALVEAAFGKTRPIVSSSIATDGLRPLLGRFHGQIVVDPYVLFDLL